MANYLFEYLKFSSQVFAKHEKKDQYNNTFVPGAVGGRGADLPFETLLKMHKPQVEELTGLELFPTYSYSRIYTTGNTLPKHRDRASCEVSVSVKLGDTSDYNWPIFMDGKEVYLDDGDAVIYKGCEVEHWREELQHPGYYLGQVFLHYVDKNGPNAEFKYDKFLEKEEFFTTNLIGN